MESARSKGHLSGRGTGSGWGWWGEHDDELQTEDELKSDEEAKKEHARARRVNGGTEERCPEGGGEQTPVGGAMAHSRRPVRCALPRGRGRCHMSARRVRHMLSVVGVCMCVSCKHDSSG